MSNPREFVKSPIHPIAIGPSAPQVQVVEVGAPRKHLFRGNKVAVVNDIAIKNTETGRISHARSDRFNGKKDGYVFVRDASKP